MMMLGEYVSASVVKKVGSQLIKRYNAIFDPTFTWTLFWEEYQETGSLDAAIDAVADASVLAMQIRQLYCINSTPG